VPKSREIDKDRQHMKFLALNVDFNGSSLNLLGSRKPVHDDIKDHPVKVAFLLLGQFSIKTVADRQGPITTSTNEELFSRINSDDFERF